MKENIIQQYSTQKKVMIMIYKNFITIEDYGGDEIYLRDCFNEGVSTDNYEIFDVDLIATEIGRFMLDERIPKMTCKSETNIHALAYNCVTDYIDDFRQHLIEEVENFVYNNLNG